MRILLSVAAASCLEGLLGTVARQPIDNGSEVAGASEHNALEGEQAIPSRTNRIAQNKRVLLVTFGFREWRFNFCRDGH